MLEDKINNNFADPAERLAHYLDHAVGKDEEVEAKEVSDFATDLLQNVKKHIEIAQSAQSKLNIVPAVRFTLMLLCWRKISEGQREEVES